MLDYSLARLAEIGLRLGAGSLWREPMPKEITRRGLLMRVEEGSNRTRGTGLLVNGLD